MTRNIQTLALNSILLIFNSVQAQPELLSSKVFSLGDVQIGSTTIDGVQELYGKAVGKRVSAEDEAAVRICYANASTNGKTFIVFESGPMGGFKRVTGFRITTRNPTAKCFTTAVDLSALISGNGVQLGQSRTNFLKLFNINFKPVGQGWVYEDESRREATKEELERLRTIWPNEKQTFFDVTTTIKAGFKNDHLIDYYVSKLESD